MKKRWILGIILVICLLLEGCSTGNEKTGVSLQESKPEEAVAESASEGGESEKYAEQTEKDAEEEAPAEEAPAEEVSWSGVSYMTAYWQFLKAYVEENKFAYMARVALAFIDDDNIPELLLIEDNSHATGVKVYTYDQESVIELGEFGSMGSMQYVERGGMILGTFTAGGEFDDNFFRVESGEAKPVCSLMSYQPPDGRPEVYEIDGVSVTEEVYNKKWEELYDTAEFVVVGYDDALAIRESELADLLAEAQNALLLQKESPRFAEMVAEQSEVLEGYGAFLEKYITVEGE